MIVFLLMLSKLIFSVISPFVGQFATSFSALSVPMLLAWGIDSASVEFLAFKSSAWSILFVLYILAWMITPWLTISKKDSIAIVGLSFVIGCNSFDIISCILSTLSTSQKIWNLLLSVLIILLSIGTIYKKTTPGKHRYSIRPGCKPCERKHH